jgi:hypothetical protein
MRTLALMSVLVLSACERIDYIEIAPTEVVFKQPNNQTWLEAKCMARNGVRAVKARVTWSVADPAIAKVDQKGLLSPVGDGETEVIAKVGDIEARTPVRVVYVDHLEIDPAVLTVKEGSPAADIKVTAFRKNGKAITDRSTMMTSVDKKIAQVVGSGSILGLDPGTTTINVQVDGAHASFQVIVEPDKQKK